MVDGRVDAPREQRLEEFFRRLEAGEPVATFEAARSFIDQTLDAVEDEMTEIPNNPATGGADGRMYPAKDDAMRDVPNHPDVTRFRHRKHNTFIRNNGAFEIRSVTDEVLVTRPGADGRGVWLP